MACFHHSCFVKGVWRCLTEDVVIGNTPLFFKLHHPISLPDLGPAHERFFELNDSIRSKYEPQIEALRKVIETDSRVGKCGRPIFYNYTIIDGL